MFTPSMETILLSDDRSAGSFGYGLTLGRSMWYHEGAVRNLWAALRARDADDDWAGHRSAFMVFAIHLRGSAVVAVRSQLVGLYVACLLL